MPRPRKHRWQSEDHGRHGFEECRRCRTERRDVMRTVENPTGYWYRAWGDREWFRLRHGDEPGPCPGETDGRN